MKKKIVLQSPEQCTLAINILQGIQDAMVANPDGATNQIEIRPYKSSRSLSQNNLLHMWCRQLSLDYAESHGKFYSPEHWKLYMTQMFLGSESTEVNGVIITDLRKTSKLNVKEFTEFLEQVDMYAGSELSIMLAHPEDMYREAMRK